MDHFLIGLVVGGVGNFIVLWLLYPILVARTVRIIQKKMNEEVEEDPADFWKPKDWRSDS